MRWQPKYVNAGTGVVIKVLDKMFMFDSFQNGSIKLINISWAY